MVDISVVIGFKDWGIHRLRGAVRSLTTALSALDSEIIVSDFGSVDASDYRSAIEGEGAIYVRTETDGVWSRSRALNAGLRVATGEVLVTTDADMVFSPKTFNMVLSEMQVDPTKYLVMQCNDLPAGIDHNDIERGVYPWSELTRIATLRPRWGMGGMIAFPRWSYLAIRGLDERMKIYGGEDIDLARRLRRAGLKLDWLDHPDAQMYHVWHPSSRDAAGETPAGRKAISLNRYIQLRDSTVARNLVNWEFAPPVRDPLVSVVISTFNRIEYLPDAIDSALAQTFSDFEIIVINDGSTDGTADYLSTITDPRVRHFSRQNQGLASARNFATSVSRGRYIAVMDDDDVMLPTRLEDSLLAIKDGANGAYGGWIDFENETGRRHFRTGKRLSVESILFTGSTFLHPTLMIERRWMQAIPYDEDLRSGSDYNMAIRMLRSGVKLEHCGKYVLMRRNHTGQITAKDPAIQKAAGAITSLWGRALMSTPEITEARNARDTKDKISIEAQRIAEPRVVEFLPDKVVRRSAFIRRKWGVSITPDAEKLLQAGVTARSLSNENNVLLLAEYHLDDISLEQLLDLRAVNGLEITIETEFCHADSVITLGQPQQLPAPRGPSIDDAIIDSILSGPSGAQPEQSTWSAVLIRWHGEAVPHLAGASVNLTSTFSLHSSGTIYSVGIGEAPNADPIDYALRITSENTDKGIEIVVLSGEDTEF